MTWIGVIFALSGCSIVPGDSAAPTNTTIEAPAVSSGSYSSDDDPPLTASILPTSSTVAPPTSASTTTTAPATTTTISSTTASAAPPPPPAVPDGSGCNPGGDLGDGRWYGFITDANADSIEFDLACRFTDQNASLAQVEDGESPVVVDDSYVRNNNPSIRTLAVRPDIPMTWHPDDDPRSAPTTYGEWLKESRTFVGVWVVITGGQVSIIEEVWEA